MPSDQEYRRTEEVLDIQEKYLSDQLKRHENEIAGLRRKRRRRVVLRSLSLFCGVVLVLFGLIDLIAIQNLNANVNNIIIFTLSELIAFPFLRYGLVLFRKMPIEQEISAAVEKFVETQDSVALLREERLKLIRTPIKAARPETQPLLPVEPLVNFDDLATQESSATCPECGENVREGAKICRKCGHLFI